MMWLVAAAFAESLDQIGLLVCDDPGACTADAAWVTSMGGGGRGGFQVVDFGGAFTTGAIPDGMASQSALRESIEAAATAVGKKQWSAAVTASDQGIKALREWRGPVTNRQLFDLYFLRGVAEFKLGRNKDWSYAFRQAAAIADGLTFPLPEGLDADVTRAWYDEQRKLVVGGKGMIALGGGPAGTEWAVDGRPAQPGSIELWAGLHRVTATSPGRIRTWRADVPVLPSRTSNVEPSFTEADQATWVLDRLNGALDTLDAPDSVKDLLVAFAGVHEVQELRLMRVETVREVVEPATIAMTEAPTDRPAAAAGELDDHGDGIPATYETEVVQRKEADDEARHTKEVNRLRVVFFDPVTRRFSADTRVATALVPAPERLRVGMNGSFVAMMERFHLGGDLSIEVPIGPIAAEGRIGLSHANLPYNLYADWVDQELFHAYLGVRYSPRWTLSPYVGLGAELFAPVAFGGRGEVGLEGRFGEGWLAEVSVNGGYLDTGMTYGVGLGVSRGF